MSRGAWDQIKSSKRFNVLIYRKLGSILVFSLVHNVMLCILVSRIYFSRPDIAFYSTDGVTPPVEIEALAAPNDSSVPLLKSDPPSAKEQEQVP